jgi:putative membrane protein
MQISQKILVLSLSFSTVAALSGCKAKNESAGALDTTKAATATDTTARTAPATTPAAPAMTDANIVAILDAANESDSAFGAMAVKKTKNPQVRQFARLMMAEHHLLRQQGQDLAKKLNVTPAPPANFDLPDKQKAAMSDLETKTGAAFDKAYIDHEVDYHQVVLQTANQALSAAQNPELKDLIQKAAPVIQKHLDMAKQIQTKLNSGTA